MTVPGRSSAVPTYGTTRSRRTPIAGIDMLATVVAGRSAVGLGLRGTEGVGLAVGVGEAVGVGSAVGVLARAEGLLDAAGDSGVTRPDDSPTGPATSAHPTIPATAITAQTIHRPTLRR
jgi:hypothetical protein